MKISNNALNFLLAQYRAIFKRAYVKGIASAVLLTAGLAAGQAADAAAISGGAASWDAITTTNSVTIANGESGSTPAKGEEYFYNVTVKSGGTFDNSGSATQLVVTGTFTNEGTVDLTKNTSDGWGIVGYPMFDDQQLDTSKVAGTFDNKNTLKITDAQLQMQNVYLRKDSTTTISGDGIHDSANGAWWDAPMIVADNLQIESGATVNMSGGQLVATLGGTMKIAGDLTMSGDAFLRATDNYNSDGTLMDPNAAAGKIVIAKTANVTVNSGSTGGIFANDVSIEGTLDIKSGSNITIGGDLSGSDAIATAAESSASSNVKLVGGTISIENGAEVAIGGSNTVDGEEVTSTLVVESGTLENNSADVTLSTNLQVADGETAKLTGTGTYTLTETGGLTMSSEKMAAFAETGKVDASTGTLTFTDAVDLSELDIFNTDGSSAGIKIAADTVFAGENITMTSGFKGVKGYYGEKEYDDAKLGDNNYDGSTIESYWAKVIAHNTLDLQGKNDQFLIKGTELKLDRPYYQIDENDDFMLDNCGNKIENTVGRVTGDELILSSDSASGASSGLVAKHGHWVVDNDIVVSGGLIKADTTQTSSLTAHNTPAYLELTGDLDLIDTYTDGKQYSFITAKGTGATVDVSGVGNLTLNNTARKRIQAYEGGTIVFAGDQVEDLLGANTTNSSGAKSMLFVLNSGTLAVTDSLDLTFDQLKTDYSLKTANYIALKGNSTVDVAGTLNLTTGEAQKNTSTALSIGSTNTIKADTLILENRDETQSGSVWVKEADVAVKDGTLIALSNLTVRNDNLLLGSGGKAAIELGDSDSYIAAKPATGTVNAESITVESGSWIHSYGDWTQNGKMTVNSGSFTANGSYQGTELTLGTNGKAWFKGVEDGTASSFTRVTASAANSLQVNSGTLRIEGEVVPGVGSAANTTNPWGVNLANGAVQVDAAGTLVFGTVASDNAFTVGSNNTVTMGTGFGTINLQGGTVELNFDQSFTNGIGSAALVSLKKTWLGGTGDNGALNGWLDIGDTDISDLSSILTASEDGTYYTATQAKYAPIVDVLASVKNEQVENLLLTEVKDDIKGVYGALQTTANNQAITIADDTILSNAGINGGNFATVGNTSTLADLNVTGGELTLDSTKSAGAAGAIDLAAGSTLSLEGTNAITVAEITGSGYISAHTDTTVNAGVKGNSLYTYADVVVAGDVDLTSGISNNYDNVNGGTLLAASTNTDGSVTYHNVDAGDSVDFDGGFLEAQNVTLSQGGEFVGDALLRAHGKLTLGGDLYLGQASEEAACPTTDDVVGSAGYMETYELDLSGHDIVIDPDYDQHASVGATQYFKSYTPSNTHYAGTADGSLYLGQNSAFGVGATIAETQEALAGLKLTDSTGALTNGTGAVLYVNRGFTVATGNKIVLDSTATRSELTSSQHEANKAGNNYSAYLEAESGIIMTDNAFGEDMTATAITFEDSGAQVYAETGSKIILAGQRFTTTQPLNLLNDADNNGVDIVGENADGSGTIRVQTENGLLVYDLTGKDQGTSVTLGLNHNARSILSGASDPIYETIVQYATNDLDGDTATTDDPVLGEGYTPESIAAYEASNPRDESLLVRNAPDNALLTASVNSGNGQAAESAARLAVYGGAVQAALTSAKSSSEVIASRMGIGAQAADLTTADNGVGGGLWVAPIYKNVDSDGFEAQGVDYGTDLNLYGVSLGADYAFMPELRVGLMFNVGSGDADGQGIASNVSNDFDYWGVGMYAGYNVGNFTVVADLGYSTVDNDVTAASGLADIGELSSSMDASIFTIGVTGQYALEFSGVDIKPHAGLRYSSLDLDDYTVDSAVAGEVAGYEADSLSIFSIPVGVTISKDIVAGNWTVKPSFDLTLQGNFGDDEAEGTVGWNGVANLDKNLTTEVFDNFTYGANLGVAAQTGNFSLGVGVGYVGSSNTDEFSASANARFTF